MRQGSRRLHSARQHEVVLLRAEQFKAAEGSTSQGSAVQGSMRQFSPELGIPRQALCPHHGAKRVVPTEGRCRHRQDKVKAASRDMRGG